MEEQKKKLDFKGNIWIIGLLVAVFTAFGIFMMDSAKMSEFWYNGASWTRNIGWGILGILCMAGCSFVNLEKLKKAVPYIGLLAVVSLFLLQTDLGIGVYGTVRWLDLGPVSIQSGEVAVFAYVLLLAVISGQEWERLTRRQFLCLIWGLAAVLALFVSFFAANLNHGVVMMGIAFLLTLVLTELYTMHLVVFGAGAGAIAVSLAVLLKTAEETFRLARLKAWLNPYAYRNDRGFQAVQQLEAVKSGGWFGKGYRNSVLAESYTGSCFDSILSLVCEQFGWIAAALVVAAVLFLLYQIYQVLQKAFAVENRFGAALVMGVLAHIGLCAFIYMARNFNLLPNGAGMFPFVTCRGLSNMLVYCEMGLVLAVAKSSEKML